jgi:hypothetical protein
MKISFAKVIFRKLILGYSKFIWILYERNDSGSKIKLKRIAMCESEIEKKRVLLSIIFAVSMTIQAITINFNSKLRLPVSLNFLLIISSIIKAIILSSLLSDMRYF